MTFVDFANVILGFPRKGSALCAISGPRYPAIRAIRGTEIYKVEQPAVCGTPQYARSAVWILLHANATLRVATKKKSVD